MGKARVIIITITLIIVTTLMILRAINNTNVGVVSDMYYHLQEMESMIQSMESDILEEIDSYSPAEYETYTTTSYIEVREPTAIFLSSIPINLSTTSPLEQDVLIGLDTEGEYLYFRDLENAHFFMTFPIQGGYVWFFGGLNEQGQWHESAIQNDFNIHGELLAVLEGQFYNGQLVGAYRQITREANQFRVHHRYIHDGFTEGDTFVYLYVDFPSDSPFRFDDATKHNLTSYYRGRISDNRYNDTTGNAIYIDFTEDGYIRAFYLGHFANGTFNDHSATGIFLDNQQTQYVINVGRYSGGSFVRDGSGYSRAIPTSENPTNLLPPGLDICETLLRWKAWDNDNV